MTPSALHGLNIIQPPQPPYTSDTQDLLSPPFPDLTAQLDIWTNLTFESDEPIASQSDPRKGEKYSSSVVDDEREEEGEAEGIARTEGHANVVTPTIAPAPQLQSPFDLNAILSGFGIDPFLVPPVSAPLSSQTASLVQLLSAYPSAAAFYPFHNVQQQAQQQVLQQPQDKESSAQSPTKRARTRKASTSSAASPASTAPTPDTTLAPAFPDASPNTDTPPTPSEDKRRRNTAASARFRLKKKEREAALEQKSHDLEVRVTELERECDQLRRENGWLKGLVVGVTGASAGVSASGVTGAGTKRRREQLEEGAAGNKVSAAN